MEQFTWFLTENAIAHPPSALAAWNRQQQEIDRLRAEIIALREQADHLRQQAFEASQRRLRLVHSAA